MIVFVSHAANDGYLPSYLGRGFGQVGVMLFFVLSGFLMAHLYLLRDFSKTNVYTYGLARVGRVFPLYIALLTFAYIISSYVYESYFFDFSDTEVFLMSLSFIKAKYTFWTIPVEVQFYVIFVIYWQLFDRGVSPFVLILAFIVLTLASQFLLDLNFPIFEYGFSFFIGITTSIIHSSVELRHKLKKVADYLGLPFLILLLLNLPELRRRVGLSFSDDIYLSTWMDPITWFLVYGLFVCSTLNSSSLAFLSLRPFAFFGGISYGFYLFHRPILFHANEILGGSIFVFLFVFFVTTVLSYVSLSVFEKPLAARIRGFHKQGQE